MVSFYNPYGKISITESYFAELVAEASKSAVGRNGRPKPGRQPEKRPVPGFPRKGVRVAEENGTR